MSNIQKLFAERIEIFGSVEFSKVSVVTGIVKIALKVRTKLSSWLSVLTAVMCCFSVVVDMLAVVVVVFVVVVPVVLALLAYAFLSLLFFVCDIVNEVSFGVI